MEIVMRDFGGLIIFLHVFSAVVWVGGMIAIRFAVHPSLQNIEDSLLRVARTLELMENFFRIVLPLAVTIIITAIMLQTGFKLSGLEVQIKQGIWTIMFLNFIWMILKRNSAQKELIMGNLKGAGEILKPIPKVMLPLNIFLGVLAIYFGVGLRGF